MIHSAAILCRRKRAPEASSMPRKRLREHQGAMPLSRHDFREWQKHTPEEWQQWVDTLPPWGNWGYSSKEWREWTHLMMEIQRDMDEVRPQERKRAAQKAAPPSPSPEEEEERGPLLLSAPQCSPRDAIASTPAQGPPAQGQASSSSAGPPAQGPPAQGHRENRQKRGRRTETPSANS